MKDSAASLISSLDSQRFGFTVAKVNDWQVNINQLLHELSQSNVSLIIAKVSCEKIDLLNQLESLGFQVKDVQIVFKHFFERKKLHFTLPDAIKIREVEEKDIAAICTIARESFRGYGHYFADKRLKREDCEEIYEDWTRRCCNDPKAADKVLVAEYNNQLAGFMAFQLHLNETTQFATANISAVSSNYRGYGLYQWLMKTGLSWALEREAKWMEGNALTTNYPVLHALFKMHFKAVNSFATLHGWMDEDF